MQQKRGRNRRRANGKIENKDGEKKMKKEKKEKKEG